MAKMLHHLLVAGLLLTLQGCQAITEPSEVSALLSIKDGFGNATRLPWNTSSDPCEDRWRGVLCTPVTQAGNRHITGIQLPGNKFNRTLSSAVGALTSLTLLDLNGNLLTGDIPLEVAKLTQLQRFVVHGNGFTGPLDPWMAKLTNLRIADFSLNHFSGPFPDIGKTLNTLQNFDCSVCSLTGSIPPSVGLLSSLQRLGLGGNNLTGSIPPELGSIGGLQLLNAQNNSLSGIIPPELGSLTNLNMLYLAYNNLTGDVPSTILGNAALQARFDGNPLCSSPTNVVVCAGVALPPLGIIAGAPPGFGGPEVPGAPGAPGAPANSTANSTAAAPLGAAPAPGSNSTGNTSSGSNATAPGSAAGVNQSTPASIGVPTPTTSGGGSSAIVTPPLSSDGGSSFPLGATIGIVMGAAALFALAAFLGLLVLHRRRRERDDASSIFKTKALLANQGSGAFPSGTSGSETSSGHAFFLNFASGSESTTPQVSGDHGRLEAGSSSAPLLFTYRELQKLTDGFDPARQIGEGGFGRVYWAQAKDTDVAVKRLDKDAATSARHGEKQFRTEVDVMSRLRHPNLLALIGYCADGGERALVYPLMKNRSLFDQLHRAPERSPALSTWRNRLTIAAQSSSALAYLHDEASPPVIHRDFTSSNILLDGDWTAVVSDFGLAKLMAKPGTPSMVQSTRLHGTLGYLAPEYLRGHVTEKNDVYSFGVVLLELLSGRRAVVSEEFDLVQWAIDVIDGPAPVLQKLLDPAVQDEAPVAMLDVAVRVARLCVETDPKRRPRMRDVCTSLNAAIETTYGADSSLVVRKPLVVPSTHTVVNIPG